jgi:hypothetical protein
MVKLSAEIKRGFLNALYIQSKAASTPLQDALEQLLLTGFDAVKSGRLVVSHAGSGKVVTFQMPPIGKQFTQEAVFELSQELLEVYADACVTLGISSDEEEDTANDPNVFATMLNDDRLQSVTDVYRDFTSLGWAFR